MRSVRNRALTVAALVLLWPALLLAHGVLRKSDRANRGLLRAAPRVILVDAFSPMTLIFAGALAVTGIVAAVLRIGA